MRFGALKASVFVQHRVARIGNLLLVGHFLIVSVARHCRAQMTDWLRSGIDDDEILVAVDLLWAMPLALASRPVGALMGVTNFHLPHPN